MNLWTRLMKLAAPHRKADEMPFSIVLLLREPHFFTEGEIQAAGERGWKKSFDGHVDPMYFVIQNAKVTMIKAGANVVNLLQVEQPYVSDHPAVAKQLPGEEQKRAWLEHKAWAALDLWNKDVMEAEAYAILARFALHLGDANCTGVFLPKSGVLMPNDGTAEEGLRRLLMKESLR